MIILAQLLGAVIIILLLMLGAYGTLKYLTMRDQRLNNKERSENDW